MRKKLIAIGVISLFIISGIVMSAAAIPTDDTNGSGQKQSNKAYDACGRFGLKNDDLVVIETFDENGQGKGCSSTSLLIGGNKSGPLQKLYNRLCDMFGWCRGTGLIANLVEITGILEYVGTNFYIGDAELHFGPTWYIQSTESAIDFDDDGVNESVFDELQGLVGTNVTVEAHEQSDGWYSVFTINGEVYREPGVPIWAGTHRWRWRNNQPTT